MYLFEWIIKDIRLDKWRTVLMIGTSFILVVFLGVFIQSIKNNEIDLKEINNSIEVKMVLHRNDGGTDLMLPIEAVEEFKRCAFFETFTYTAAFEYASNGYEPKENYEKRNDLVFWVNPTMVTGEGLHITNLLIVGDQSKDLAYGECIAGFGSLLGQAENSETVVFSPQVASSNIGSNCIRKDLTVVERYDGNSIFLNYNQYIEICKELDIPVIIYSAEYIIKDNERISEVHNFLSNAEIFKDKKNGLHSDYTYKIYDGILEDSTAPLLRNISIMKGIFPLLLLIIVFIGFLLSYTTGRLEKRTIFLMHSMGTPRSFQFFTIFIKQLLYCMLGALPGLIFLSIRYVALYIICYLSGSIFSIFRMLYMKFNEGIKE